MSTAHFSVGRYYNQDEERQEWGVFHSGTRVWHFPDTDTEEAALELSERLNRSAT